MAATPVYGVLTLKGRGMQMQSITTTDVVNGYWTFDGTSQKFYIVPMDCMVEDIAMSGDGTDTKKVKLFINGRDVGVVLRLAGLVNTVNNRIPVAIGPIKAGSMIQFQELA